MDERVSALPRRAGRAWALSALLMSAAGCGTDGDGPGDPPQPTPTGAVSVQPECKNTEKFPEFAWNPTMGNGVRLPLDQFCAEASCLHTLSEMDDAYDCTEVDPPGSPFSDVGYANAKRTEGCGRVLYDSLALRMRSYSVTTGALIGAVYYDDTWVSMRGCLAPLFVAGDIELGCANKRGWSCTRR